ncbi:N-acetylmuramoyl-L-alanine amidase [Streptomyces xanthophaeus]|uniref:N-acetylmuramoyl-L-alanine amidase n=1 Tax=Streptomyces xanthophaeus TaxID=67385 RepID=UPI00398F98B0
MAWYPGAQKMELQPESDNQPAIKPTQFIMHSIAAPWTVKRTYEYWRDSTNLESHFGLDYKGPPGQYLGTQTRADANYLANLRPDGSGAVSIETASNTSHTDPWSESQVEELIKLGVWLHRQHGIPLRICRSASDPGFGYHRLHAAWAKGGTDCPGDARVAQFKNVVFPGIVARANGQTQEDIVTPAEITAIASAVWNHPLPRVTSAGVQDGSTTEAYWLLVWQDYAHAQLMAAIADSKLTPAELAQALADGTLKVEVTVAPAATPNGS